jgi:hypothetical protein
VRFGVGLGGVDRGVCRGGGGGEGGLLGGKDLCCRCRDRGSRLSPKLDSARSPTGSFGFHKLPS